MKLPLWAWDTKQSKYIVFPLELLKQYADGKYGLDWPVFIIGQSAQAVGSDIRKFFREHYHFFEAEKDHTTGRYWRYVLKETKHANDRTDGELQHPGTDSEHGARYSGASDPTEGGDGTNI